MENIGRYNIILELVSNSQKAASDIEKIKKQSTGLAGVFNRAKGAFAGILAANVVTSAINGVRNLGRAAIQSATEYEQAAVSFEVFTGSAENARDLLQELEDFSLETPFTPQQVQSAAKTLLGFGRSTQEVIGDLETLGNVSAATGTDLGQLGLVFGQVAGVGKLQGQDALQFINAGIPLYQILAESIGASVGEVKELQSQGKITFDVLNKAFQDASKEGGKFEGALIKQSQTIGGLFSTLQGIGQNVLRNLGNAFLPLLREVLPSVITGFRSAANIIGSFASRVGELASSFFGFIRAGIRPLVESFGNLRTSLRGLVGDSDTVQLVLNNIAKTFVFLSNVVSSVINIVASLITALRSFSATEFGRTVTQPFRDVFEVVSNLPAIFNGALEAAKAFFKGIENFGARNAIQLRIYAEEFKRFGNIVTRQSTETNDRIIADLKALKTEFESESIGEAYQRGFDAINNIEVETPEIDTPENIAKATQSGENIGSETAKGVKKGIEKDKEEFIIKPIKDVLEESIETARAALENAFLTGDFIGAARIAGEIDILEEKLNRFLNSGSNRNVEPFNPLPLVDPSEVDSTIERYRKQLSELRGQLESLSDPKLKDDVQSQIENVIEIIKKLEPGSLNIGEVDLGDDSGNFLQRALGLDDDGLAELKTAASDALQETKKFLDDVLQAQIDRSDKEIEVQEDRVNKATTLAERGNTAILSIERERLNELLNERERALQRQRQLAAVEIALNQALAISRTIANLASNPLVAAFQIAALVAGTASAVVAINSAFGNVPSFDKGTNRLTGNQNVDGKGGMHIIGHKDERIMTAAQNKAIGFDMSNSEVVNAVRLYKGLRNPRIPSAKMQVVGGSNMKGVEDKLDVMNENLENMRVSVRMDEKGMRVRQEIMKRKNLRRKKAIA